MKTLTIFLLLCGSLQAFASNDSARRIRNDKIVKCMKAVHTFFRNTRWENGRYYEGQNNKGRCFMGYTALPHFNGMNLFLNSKQKKYIASIEISIEDRHSLHFTNDIKQCQVTGTSFVLRNVYRMPRTIYYGSDGSVKLSWPIFDVVYNQYVKIIKKPNGRLVSAKFDTEYGVQTCNFD